LTVPAASSSKSWKTARRWCSAAHKATIQTNQHGDANRRTPENYTVPLLSQVHNDLHPAARELIPAERHQAFIDYFSRA